MGQTTTEFFASLSEPQREAIIECAQQGIRDELSDYFMRDNEILSTTDEELADLLERIRLFWEANQPHEKEE